jgi:hypothetical protein
MIPYLLIVSISPMAMAKDKHTIICITLSAGKYHVCGAALDNIYFPLSPMDD